MRFFSLGTDDVFCLALADLEDMFEAVERAQASGRESWKAERPANLPVSVRGCKLDPAVSPKEDLETIPWL